MCILRRFLVIQEERKRGEILIFSGWVGLGWETEYRKKKEKKKASHCVLLGGISLSHAFLLFHYFCLFFIIIIYLFFILSGGLGLVALLHFHL